MENKGVLTKVLAVAGAILVWFPILAPILLTAVLFIQRQVFRFDYLMPAELGLFAFGGGILLLVAAFRAHSHWKLIAWGLGIAVVMIIGAQALAEITGLADGLVGIGGWQWMLVIGGLVAYILAIVAVGIGGILLLRDLFKPHQLSPLTR